MMCDLALQNPYVMRIHSSLRKMIRNFNQNNRENNNLSRSHLDVGRLHKAKHKKLRYYKDHLKY